MALSLSERASDRAKASQYLLRAAALLLELPDAGNTGAALAYATAGIALVAKHDDGDHAREVAVSIVKRAGAPEESPT